LNTYIVTFPQKDKIRGDGWVRVKAPDVQTVQRFAEKYYVDGYSAIFEEIDFVHGHYPKGCLEEHEFNFI
jgi:hypothetical protein